MREPASRKQVTLESGRRDRTVVYLVFNNNFMAQRLAGPKRAKTWRQKRPPLREGEYLLFRPIRPNRKIWDQLKTARTVTEVRKAARNFCRWAKRNPIGRDDLAQTLSSHARDFLKAKGLPEYARSHRTQSDNKRIFFLSKVMAGLTQRRSTSYTLKRLAGWKLPEAVRAMASRVAWK